MNQIPNIEERIKDIFKELHNSIELSLGSKQSIKWALEQKQEDVISTLHQQLQKAREEERERIKEFLPIMRECKSGCGCRYEGEGHEGGCVWQPKEYYEAYELEPLFKAIQSELDQPTNITNNK